MNTYLKLTLILLCACMSGCASTRSVKELERIQSKNGFYSQSLYYCGSTKAHHYFDQFVLFDRWIVADMLLPGKQGDGYESYRVPRSEVALPPGAEFPRNWMKGSDDKRVRKLRIVPDPKHRGKYTAVFRKMPGERLNDAWHKFQKLDARSFRTERLPSGEVRTTIIK